MTVEIYPSPYDLLQPRIKLQVKTTDSDWQDVPVMFASSEDEEPHLRGGCEGWATLSTDSELEFKATFPDPIFTGIIRPSMQDKIEFTKDGFSINFTVTSPRYLVIEINRDSWSVDNRNWPHHTLYLMIDDITEQPEGNIKVMAPGHHMAAEFKVNPGETLFLEPGIHTVEEQIVEVFSDTTLYLAGGAHLRSYIIGEAVENFSLKGRGVIDGTGVFPKSREWRDDGDAGFVFFRRGKNILIDGVCIFDSPHWNIVTFGTEGTIIRNHKAITWKVNNDGVQPRSCNNMLVENSFLKCADDCIAIKTRRTAGLTSRNITCRNLVLWNDLPGNAVEIGHTSQADLLENVHFENIEVVHAATGNNKTEFTISISLIDHCTVQNVSYKDFFVEGVHNGDFRFWISNSRYTTDDKPGHIHNVTVENYHVQGDVSHSLFEGFDEEHKVCNIELKNITYNDKKISNLKELNPVIINSNNITIS